MQTSTQHFSSMNSCAVVDKLHSLVAGRARFCYISFSRNNIFSDLLPVVFPCAALFCQLVQALQEDSCAVVACHLATQQGFDGRRRGAKNRTAQYPSATTGARSDFFQSLILLRFADFNYVWRFYRCFYWLRFNDRFGGRRRRRFCRWWGKELLYISAHSALPNNEVFLTSASLVSPIGLVAIVDFLPLRLLTSCRIFVSTVLSGAVMAGGGGTGGIGGGFGIRVLGNKKLMLLHFQTGCTGCRQTPAAVSHRRYVSQDRLPYI